ncbi:uncharacterized protein LOC129869786 [Solanum dulcamara]|uniref:uncharacterized protein LOC129869786 n=1 Tax=Solanum dulcamara TaxID=45834 RepID=UPI0024869595|nr:uncharacterized protein LOC129869786 [Solanum dulcamara]
MAKAKKIECSGSECKADEASEKASKGGGGRFLLGNWDNNEEALQMAILYFIHTFLFSQLGDTTISVDDFRMIEDGRYEHFPWGQLVYSKLMRSMRLEFTTVKQLYHLGGMPYALNAWMYECASVVHPNIAVIEENQIPRICNWRVVGLKPKYGIFMSSIISEVDFCCTKVDQKFSDLESLINSNNRKICDFESLIKSNHSVMLKAIGKEVDSLMKDRPGTCNPNRKNDFDGSGRTDSSFEQYSPTSVGEMRNNDPKFSNLCNIEEQVHDQESSEGSSPNIQSNIGHEVSVETGMATTFVHDIGHGDTNTNQNKNKFTKSNPISLAFREDIDAFNSEIHVSIDVQPLNTITPYDDQLLRYSQLPTTLPCLQIIAHDVTKTRAPRFTICDEPPREILSEYSQWIDKGLLRNHATNFGKIDYVVAYSKEKNWFYLMSQPKKCWNDEHIDVIFYYLRKKSKLQNGNHYRYTTTNCIFKDYINMAHARYYSINQDFSTQEDMARGADVSRLERSVTNIIRGLFIPAGLPWYLVDDVYIPVNCAGDYHWALLVVVLKERLKCVYDSSMGSRKKEPYVEIQKLAQMLQTYIVDNGLLEKSDRTDWSVLDTYKDKSIGMLLD